jgi:hypothetical protein
MTPHPYASVIKAAADGATVQSRPEGRAEWLDWNNRFFPTFSDGYEWRVKPQTLRYRVALFLVKDGAYTITCETKVEAASIEEDTRFLRWLHDWQEVEV